MGSSRRIRGASRGGWQLAIVAAASLLVSVIVPGTVVAGSGNVNLALLPIGQAGAFFDVVMRPGDTRRFELAIANNGTDKLAVRTYAADVYTIINGGFGGRLRGEPGTGMTDWMTYPTDVMQLSAGETVRRSLVVSVPLGAGPGEYISSILLENDRPLQGGGAVGLDQIVRQAIAVVVTVPGRRAPELEIGRANHKVVAGTSTVAIAVSNPGNVRLKPIAAVTIVDSAGTQVSRATVAMDTFYAHTATFVEVPLDALLASGRYVFQLSLDDESEGLQVDGSAAFVVEARAATATTGDELPFLAKVFQPGANGQAPIAAWVAGLLVGLTVVLVLVFIRRRRAAQRQ